MPVSVAFCQPNAALVVADFRAELSRGGENSRGIDNIYRDLLRSVEVIVACPATSCSKNHSSSPYCENEATCDWEEERALVSWLR